MVMRICVFLWYAAVAALIVPLSLGEVVKVSLIGEGANVLHKPVTLLCQSNDTSVVSGSLKWMKDNAVLPNSKEFKSPALHHASYHVHNVTFDNFGQYSCLANLSSGEVHNVSYEFLFNVDAKVLLQPIYTVREGQNASIVCTVVGYPSPSTIHWDFSHGDITHSDSYPSVEFRKNPGEISSTLHVINSSPRFNGTYRCMTPDGTNYTQLIVKSKPTVRFEFVKAVGRTKIFCNWTLTNGNSKIKWFKLKYFQTKKQGAVEISLNSASNSFLLVKLQPGETYFNFTLSAANEVGESSHSWEQAIETLTEEPQFTPKISVNGFTSNTVTLGWDMSYNVSEYFDYYNVSVRTKSGVHEYYTAFETPVMVERLKPGADYIFRVKACSSYIKECQNFSAEVNGTTMDGLSSAPRNMKINCVHDSKSHETQVSVSWDDPVDPQGLIMEYEVVLTGNASYFDENGRQAEDRVGPIIKHVLGHMPRQAEFLRQPPNTHLFLSVCAKTRIRRCGATAVLSCTTPESIPDTQELSKAYWRAVQKSDNRQIFFMVTLPHLSQRNGTICCLRVIVVRLGKDQSVSDLRPPHEMEILSYEVVHNGTNSGAYVADMMEATSRNIMIGDGVTTEPQHCRKCYEFSAGALRPAGQYSPNSLDRHKKRHTNQNGQFYLSSPLNATQDGPLDVSSTYTAYLDAIVVNERHERITAQSRYFKPLRPVRVDDSAESMVPGAAIVSSLIVALVVVLVALMCVMRWRSKEPGEQEYGLSQSIQQWCRRLRGQQPIPSEEPPNLPPIGKDELVAAYLDRHKDSDLGFQQEFEKLPDRFCDRTAHASDSQSNIGKNRYPDIKAYDQTRVRLSTSDNGSDYINANFVVGYKERKKFVCAQGPMEATVNDWWRMIWEQHVHFILMLTNVEEYNKTKCAKYWPSEGSTNYADFMVTHSSEKRYSDYLVRHLRLSKTRTGSGNIEDGNKEERDVVQYHYLVWKDFMAPEHPVGILRFIKRFNEAYAPDKGPILVHCSAGVGRTGTLVALDSMLQQLNEEGSVTLFNTICDLRHQRNYLVQSLKQYIFIYRALMEMAQFGDTDVLGSELKSHIEKMKIIPEGKTSSRLQEEFERLVHVIEDRKPFSVGACEEHRHRNRHENVIPYDRNRVHLSPMPSLSKEINTYINASFIEGYDNTEQFIIAQDTLEGTIGDFWRMIVEQNIRSIVMMSETGEEKCPRYWPEKDQETSHDYIKVKYMQSQSFPFYYRREFTVTDTKTDHSTLVTQFQYNGWPMGEGEVPQVDRGIVELIDTTFKFRETLEGNPGPLVVHCSDGADRSCIFVALAILTQQLMNESRVDVFSVVRKLRSQRQGLFRNFAQYEFIYRGLHTYAELHVANGTSGH